MFGDGMADEDVSDELNKLIKRNQKGEIQSIPDSQKVMKDTQSQFKPQTSAPHIETREEYQAKDAEYTQKIEQAQTLEERNKLVAERTKHRTDRLSGKYKTQTQSTPTEEPLIHNVIPTPEQAKIQHKNSKQETKMTFKK